MNVKSQKSNIQKELVGIFLLALCVYFIQSLAWPISPGRDFGSYLVYFVQILVPNGELGYLDGMLKRTPLAPLFIGITALLGGSVLLEVFASLCFATSITLVFVITNHWNKKSAYIATFLVLLYPPYASIFHFFSSDAIFATAFFGWFLLIVKTVKNPSSKMFCFNGLYVFFMIMIRPGSQVFLLFIFFPVFIFSLSPKQKIIRSGLFLCSSMMLILLYSTYNYVRYDHFVIVRSFHAQIPMMRLFQEMSLIHPENGPASKEMATHIQNTLLAREPYLSKKISIDTFFSSRSSRMWRDMKYLCDEVYGRENEFKHLALMSMEAIKTYPFQILKAVTIDSLAAFKGDGFKPEAPVSINNNQSNVALSLTDYVDEPKVYIAKRLSIDSENQPIPIASCELRALEDTESLLRMVSMQKKINSLGLTIPNRDGLPGLASFFNKVTGLFPDMFTLLMIGLGGLLFSTHYLRNTMFFVSCLAIMTVLLPVVGHYIIYQFRIPFDPLFIMLAVIGVVRSGEGFNINIFKQSLIT